MTSTLKFNKAKDIFRTHGGILNKAKAIRLGIHPKTLYNMRDQGILELLSRGLYRLSECPEISRPDLIIITQKIPHGVICLISALSFHEITTQIPHKVDIAIPLKAHRPTIDYPPVRFFWYSEKNFLAGIEIHKVDGLMFAFIQLKKRLRIALSIEIKLV